MFRRTPAAKLRDLCHFFPTACRRGDVLLLKPAPANPASWLYRHLSSQGSQPEETRDRRLDPARTQM